MNILFGKNLFGRFIFGGSTNDQNGGTAVVPTPTHEYYPGQYVVYAYAADGTRTAMFGSGIEDNAACPFPSPRRAAGTARSLSRNCLPM